MTDAQARHIVIHDTVQWSDGTMGTIVAIGRWPNGNIWFDVCWHDESRERRYFTGPVNDLEYLSLT